jgi:hypothetical protein
MLTNNQTTRTLYLPAGGWYDFFTAERHDGGQLITVDIADQGLLPLFVREGAIVPELGPDDQVPQSLVDADYALNPLLSTRPDGLDLLIYPHPTDASHFTVYDGTEVSCTPGSGLVIDVTSAPRALGLKILGSATDVERDGAALARVDDLTTVSEGWTVTGSFVRIKLAHPGGATEIVVQ